jgi:hypothetical protein
MSPERIRQVISQRPFQPFTIHTGDGSTVDVLSPEFVYLFPGGRTLHVSVPLVADAKEEGQFREHRIDVFLITQLTSPIRRSESAA